MKRLTTLALLAGLLVAAVLVATSGVDEVWTALVAAGWGMLAVVAARAVVVVLAGLGWWALFPAAARPTALACIGVRFVREGINTLLPVAQVGGDLVGARLMVRGETRGGLAGASVIVDIMAQAVTQFLFTALGLGVLVWLGGDETVIRTVAIGLALAAPALVGFYLVQRRAGHRLVGWALARLAGEREWRVLGAVDDLYENLRALYGRRRRLLASTAIHSASWLVGAVEVWIALRCMGFEVGFAEALVIESLAQAVRGAAFAVPGAVGAQEGGLIALCALFGVPAQAALALSLVKRIGDLAVGVPGLVAWRALEARRTPGEGRGVTGLGRRLADMVPAPLMPTPPLAQSYGLVGAPLVGAPGRPGAEIGEGTR